MRLEVCTPTETIGELEVAPLGLSPVVDTLQKENGSFLTLSKADGECLQVVWYQGQGFYVEYHELDADGIHYTPEFLSRELAATIVELYRGQDLAWKQQCQWDLLEHVEDEDPEGDGCMGSFEGVGLRHVLKELERNEIPCRVEAMEGGFQVFVPREFDEQGRSLIAALFPH